MASEQARQALRQLGDEGRAFANRVSFNQNMQYTIDCVFIAKKTPFPTGI